jgi:serine/threonine protein kinase
VDRSAARLAELYRRLEIEEKCREGGEAMLANLKDKNAIAVCEASLQESVKRIEYLKTEIALTPIHENGVKITNDRGTIQFKKNSQVDITSTTSSLNDSYSGDLHNMTNVISSNSMPNSASVTSFASDNKQVTSQNVVLAFPSSASSDSLSNASQAHDEQDNGIDSSEVNSKQTDNLEMRRSGSSLFSFFKPKPGRLFFGTSQNPDQFKLELSTQLPSNLGELLIRGPPITTHEGGHASEIGSLSNLSLSLTGTPFSKRKITAKMRDLDYKLELEQKVQKASERIELLYKSSPGKSEKSELEKNLQESSARLETLRLAIGAYSSLYIPEEHETNIQNEMHFHSPAKKHASGKLFVHVVSVRMPPTVKNSLSKSSSGFVYFMIKVDGILKYKSRSFKFPKDKNGNVIEIPFNEKTTVDVEKGIETEISIAEADRGGNIKSVDGLFWFRVAEIEAQSHSGWFSMDPTGTILVHISFSARVNPRQPLKLGRQGAVRKKKVESTLNGHCFILSPSNIVRCALCSEFIGVSTCYTCEACNFTCHKKCAPRVLTRCFAVVAQPHEIENEKFMQAHNIPHKFIPSTGLRVNWCCHCGHIIHMGRGNLKCSECDLWAHKDCSILVPNFCGMSMKRANLMIQEIQMAKDLRAAIEIRKARESTISGSIPVVFDDVRYSQTPGCDPSHPAILITPQTLPPQLLASNYITSPASAVSQQASGSQRHAINQQTVPPPNVNFKRVTLDDFHFLAVLGKGNFGKVMLAEEKVSKKLFAIKVLKKDFVVENDEVESTRSEKRIFLAANTSGHPFLVNLYATMQTESRLCFVMEYVSGGDLMLHIQREQFSERRAKFYASEVLLALEFFHQQNIVYRDLKLDNIMLSLDGHIKLADYGLCKENMTYGSTTNTFCGTPEFMAPEILYEQSYGRAVDWWAFGVLIYEMICGQSPFRGDDEEEIFESILHDEVLYPISMSRDAVSICQRLLIKDPNSRLGSSPHDAEEVKRHPFFREVDWRALLEKSVPPPFIPSLQNPKDVSNFDEEFTREKPGLTPINTLLDEAEQAEFKGFSYVAEWVNMK